MMSQMIMSRQMVLIFKSNVLFIVRAMNKRVALATGGESPVKVAYDTRHTITRR